ncbi:SIR2 family protein [Sphingobium sp. KCTC 72723]|uniref:SIR2 family protein n=1 Tax=Sphingobium sp. KCTC 72723 TaxID=2733867 RepID=UPI00165EBD14|nr:SIR2 family protein [Sphingobium sp. KCTC 72723]
MTVEAATNATIPDVLAQLDGDFAPMANAFGNAAFALWVGSGISFGRAPDLGVIAARALEFLRLKAVDPATQATFEPALRAAIIESHTDVALAVPHFGTAFGAWPDEVRVPIISGLWNRYSQLLNIRLPNTDEDYILWDAVDVRDAFSNPPAPGCAHLSIAILVLEGVLREIASANWDGFIEAAIERLGGGLPGNLQVVVDPAHLRDNPGKARLIKFHGCIVHATENQELYRKFLVGSTSQINAWPHQQLYTAIRNEVISLATNHRALMTGLSLQDGNLQAAFNVARQANPWPWPCDPQAHVFCEGDLGNGQRLMLQTVYAGSYNNAIADIENSALLVAWGEQVLLALVLKVLTDKLSALIDVALEGQVLATDRAVLVGSLARLRDAVAGFATDDRTAFLESAILVWSRLLSLFRTGKLPHGAGAYEVLTGGPVGGVGQDQNARVACLGELGVALALLQHGVDNGLWTLAPPLNDELVSGAIAGIASWEDADPRPLFFARSAGVAIALEKSGAFANDNAIVIHADEAWHVMQEAIVGDSPRNMSRSPGRTGRVGTQHVCLARMVSGETTAAGLAARFVQELSL